MNRIKNLRLYLSELAAAHPTEVAGAEAVHTFFTELARHDDKTVEEFCRMLAALKGPPPTGASDSVAQELIASFTDDNAFRGALLRIGSDRKVTRETLNSVYERITGRTRKLPSKATKEALLRDIADYRLERVRSQKAAEFFATRTGN